MAGIVIGAKVPLMFTSRSDPPAARLISAAIAVLSRHLFYDTTVLWQWLRVPGDVVFAAGALLMAYDFTRKLWLGR